VTLGQVAYEAYVLHCEGKSIRGENLPPWDDQHPAIMAHWDAAARKVAEQVRQDIAEEIRHTAGR
jgi:hypothetical protein